MDRNSSIPAVPTRNAVSAGPAVAGIAWGGTSFETTTDKVVPANLVGHLQVGRVLSVHYLPGDEHEVALGLPANPHL